MENPFASEKDWKAFVASLENPFSDTSEGKESVKILSDALLKSIEKDAVEPFGVLFSGGVDSTFIAFMAKKMGKKFTCYSVGLEGSQDLEWAQKISKALKLDLKLKILSLDEFEKIVKKVTNLLNEPDVTKVGVGSVFYAAASLARKDKATRLFSGLGSEEIFAGYDRHWKAFEGKWEKVHAECWNGLKNMWERDLVRDLTISKELGITPLVPFLDKDVIKAAMRIHPKLKINETQKKIVLRDIAVSLGLPAEFAQRKKKAAQYGSSFVKGLDKLAKRNGFEYKKDYLKSLLK